MTLNPEQKIAVQHIEGPMMVLAGPGTGKTQIIAMRIAHILENTQMEPHNILCLTFTESGVVAMRERLLQIVGTAAYYVRIHTFHSFCNEVIKDFPEKFISTRELEALTDIDKIQIMQSILNGLPTDSILKPFGAPHLYQRDCLMAIQNLKRENISPEDFEKELVGVDPETLKKPELKQLEKQKVLVGIYSSYQKALRENGRYDFEDMILFVVKKFKEDAEVLAHYQEQFQYILVDEYQDTNGAQNEIVRLISEYFENPNVFVVGDDKQSIYRFQGASLENILYFYNRYKSHAKLVSLRINYRSQQTILDAAHSLITNNEHGITSMIPDISQELNAGGIHTPAKLQVAALENPHSEDYFIATSVQQLLNEGVTPSEIAILYRNNRDILDLVDLFKRLNVPFRLEAGKDVLKDTDINKLIRLLELIQDLTDDHKLFYVLHSEFLGFESLDVLKITRNSSRGSNLFDKLLDHEVFGDFAKKCMEWKSLSMNKSLMEFFEILINESGYLDFVMTHDERIQKLNNLNTFFDQLKTLNRAKHDLTLEGFLEHIELLRENNLALKTQEIQSDKNAVRLMTAHKSKGLEFEHVFIMKCVDKHWGNKRSMNKLKLPSGLIKNDISQDKKAKNEDERRLFYVAMTRAKKQVTFSYFKHNGNGRPQVPSLFLQELDPESVAQIDTEVFENEIEDRLMTQFKTPKPAHSQEEASFVKGLLRHYTMSVTHLNNYLRCPRLFYYRNVLRVPSAKNKHMAFGSAVHDALKDLTLEHKKGDLPSEEFLLQQFEQALNRQVLTQQDRKGSLEYGQSTLSAYYKNYKSEFTSSALPEFNFASHGVNLDGIPLTGKLDKIELLDKEARTVHVADYKTGNPDTKSQALGPDGEYRRQIIFYKLLCDLSPKFPYTMVSGEIDFIQPSKRTQKFKRPVIEPSLDEIAALKVTIKDVYSDIMDLKFLHPDEWSTCGECEYCEFHSTSSSKISV